MPRFQTHSHLLPCNLLLLWNTQRQQKTLWWVKPPLCDSRHVDIRAIHACPWDLIVSFRHWNCTWLGGFLIKGHCFLWECSLSELPSLYFILFFDCTVEVKLLSSFIHHTKRRIWAIIQEKQGGWKHTGFLLMLNRWSAYVFVPLFYYSSLPNHFTSSSALYSGSLSYPSCF